MQTGWTDCPRDIQTQIEGFCAALQQTLTNDLVGIYLHGSLAVGCFNPDRSDIDLLVIVRRALTVETSYMLAQHLLHFSGRPRPIEITFVTMDALHSGIFPVAYELHYGEEQRRDLQKQIEDETWRQWNATPRHDPDLAGQIAVARERGVCLTGTPMAQILQAVGPAILRDCFMEDCEWAFERLTENPLYGVLNPCRTYAYVAEGRLLSKDEAAIWVMARLPESHARTVAQALEIYRGNTAETHFDPVSLQEFASCLRTRIAAECGGSIDH